MPESSCLVASFALAGRVLVPRLNLMQSKNHILHAYNIKYFNWVFYVNDS